MISVTISLAFKILPANQKSVGFKIEFHLQFRGMSHFKKYCIILSISWLFQPYFSFFIQSLDPEVS